MSDERVDKGKAEEQDFEAHKLEIQRTELGQVEPGQEPGRGELGRTKNDSEDDDFEAHRLELKVEPVQVEKLPEV